MPLIGAFLIDFVTVDFESDGKIAKEILHEFQKNCNIDNDDNRNFVLDSPIPSAGWYFAKLFLSGQFVKKLYELNSDQIDNSKDKKMRGTYKNCFRNEIRAIFLYQLFPILQRNRLVETKEPFL